MRLLSNLHVKGKPAVLPDRAIRRQSHYFIYRPRMLDVVTVDGETRRVLQNDKSLRKISALKYMVIVKAFI